MRCVNGVLVLIGTSVLMFGCVKVDTAPAEPSVRMGARAPQLGDKTPYNTLAGFVPGYWALGSHMDSTFAKQLGVGALQEQNDDQPVTAVFRFKDDGTFTYKRRKSGVTVEGVWRDIGKGIQIDYLTVGGKPISQSREEIKKAAESGTQAAVSRDLAADSLFDALLKLTYAEPSSDHRKLVFVSPGSDVQSANSALMAANALERLEAEKPK